MNEKLIPRRQDFLGITKRVSIPDNVKTSIKGKIVEIEGPLGTLRRDFEGNLDIYTESNEIVLRTGSSKKHDRALAGTMTSHIQNMILGVTKGFTYHLFIYFRHFPMSVKVEGDKVYIDNFLGERKPRCAMIERDVKVKVFDDQIAVKGINKEAVAQTAANIHQAARVKNLSLHGTGGSPGFLDGIYIFEKAAGEGEGNVPSDKRQLARRFYFEMKVCRDCGSRNAPTATQCRRCRSKNLRKRKAMK